MAIKITEMKNDLKNTIKEAMVEWRKLEESDDLPIDVPSLEDYIVAKVWFWFERIQDRR